MQKDSDKAKKTIIIDGVVYIANIHDGVYFTNKHQDDKQETSLVYGGSNGKMASVDVMIIKRGANGIDNHFVQVLPICKSATHIHCNKTLIIVIMHYYT